MSENERGDFSIPKFSFINSKALFALAVLLFCSSASAFSGHGGVYDSNLEVDYAAASILGVSSSNGVYAGGFTLPGTPSGIWASSGGAYLFRAGEFFDQNAIIIKITSPAPSATLTSQSVAVSYFADDTNTNPLAKFWVRVDAGSWLNNALATSYTFTGLANGSHTAYVVASDAYDLNSSTASVNFTVQVSTGSTGTDTTVAKATDTSAGRPTGGGGPTPATTGAAAITVADVENTANIVSKVDYEGPKATSSDGVAVSKSASFIELKGSGGAVSGVYGFNVGVKNDSSKPLKNVLVREVIPKAIAGNVSQITFKQYPAKIIKDDPEVEWLVEELAPGAEVKFFYFVKSLADKSIASNFKAYVAGLQASTVAAQAKVVDASCSAVKCDDSNICTEDSCSGSSCTHDPATREGINCGQNNVCKAGKCVALPAKAPPVQAASSPIGGVIALIAGIGILGLIFIAVVVAGAWYLFIRKK